MEDCVLDNTGKERLCHCVLIYLLNNMFSPQSFIVFTTYNAQTTLSVVHKTYSTFLFIAQHLLLVAK